MSSLWRVIAKSFVIKLGEFLIEWLAYWRQKIEDEKKNAELKNKLEQATDEELERIAKELADRFGRK